MNEKKTIDWGEVSKTASGRVKRRRSILPYIIAIAALAVAGWAYVKKDTIGVSAEDTKYQATFEVARGDLRISILDQGSLDALNSTEVQCEVEGRSTIISIVPEGAYVQKGDLLVELETNEYEEKLNQQRITVQNALASATQAVKNHEIQLNQNESDIKAASLKVDFAKIDLEKYIESDWPQKLARADADLTIASEEVSRASDKLEWTVRLEKKGYATRSERESDELALKKRKLDVEQADRYFKSLKEYDNKKEKRKLESDVEEAVMSLLRVKSRAEAQIAQKAAEMISKKSTLDLQQKQLAKLELQLENSIILAPSPGLVVYQSSRNQHRWGNDDNIEEGASVRYRQTLIALPDISTMVVKSKVHESEVSMVKPGQKAEIKLDSEPDIVRIGTVRKVSILPDRRNRWSSSDATVYSTEIVLDGTNAELRPGNSAKVEIIVDELSNVLFVPMQAVTAISSDQGTRQICYVSNGRESKIRDVTTGKANNNFVEITSGLEEGEKVLLYAPLLPRDDESGLGGQPKGKENSKQTAPTDTKGDEPSKQPLKTGSDIAKPMTAGQPNLATAVSGENGNGGKETRRPRGGQKMTDEQSKKMRERLDKMTPEEKKAAMEKMRKSRGQGRQGSRGGATLQRSNDTTSKKTTD
jgi:HlyD family secretion protein